MDLAQVRLLETHPVLALSSQTKNLP